MIAITGGPCAGKTSIMDVLRERFAQLGTSAVFVPEAATDLILSGIAPWTCTSMLEFQTHVIALQLEREAAALKQTSNCKPLVICDRGICDSHAYLSDEDYRLALKANGIDEAQALARYAAVFHLKSIAADDIQAYTRENNGARFETADEAAAVDERVLASWSDHPALQVIGNYADFADKAEALFQAIASLDSL